MYRYPAGSSPPTNGTLYLTATHLIFVDPMLKKETWILHSLIASVEKLAISPIGSPLLMRCKHFLCITFVIPREKEAHDIYQSLVQLSQPGSRHLLLPKCSNSNCLHLHSFPRRSLLLQLLGAHRSQERWLGQVAADRRVPTHGMSQCDVGQVGHERSLPVVCHLPERSLSTAVRLHQHHHGQRQLPLEGTPSGAQLSVWQQGLDQSMRTTTVGLQFAMRGG